MATACSRNPGSARTTASAGKSGTYMAASICINLDFFTAEDAESAEEKRNHQPQINADECR
jgi:hypothetical protein